MCFEVSKEKLRARMSRKNAEHCRHLLYISSPRLTWSALLGTGSSPLFYVCLQSFGIASMHSFLAVNRSKSAM
jgi:uncharacterized protein (DUF486 family)